VPGDKSAVKSFLLTAQFLSPYMKCKQKGETYADITAPLRKLTNKNVHFKWGKEQQRSFEKIKGMLIIDLTLAHYDVKRKTRLYVYHGPAGLGTVLTQWHEDPTRATRYWRPVIHTSRALNKAEQNYGKMD